MSSVQLQTPLLHLQNTQNSRRVIEKAACGLHGDAGKSLFHIRICGIDSQGQCDTDIVMKTVDFLLVETNCRREAIHIVPI